MLKNDSPLILLYYVIIIALVNTFCLIRIFTLFASLGELYSAANDPQTVNEPQYPEPQMIPDVDGK